MKKKKEEIKNSSPEDLEQGEDDLLHTDMDEVMLDDSFSIVEKEESSEEILIKAIKIALEGGDMAVIRDILRSILEREDEGGNLADYDSDDEIKKHLQEKLQKLKEVATREERAEISPVTKTVAEEVPKEMTTEEKEAYKKAETEAHDKAIEDKEMLYSTKIDLMEDAEDAHKEILKQTVKYVNKEKFADHKADFEELVKLSFNEENKEDFNGKIENLSNELGLDKAVVAGIIDTQKANLEELTYQQEKKKKSKKESKWKKIGKVLGKVAIYGVGGIGLGLITGGVGAGIGLGVARIAETIFKGKKDRRVKEEAILESKKMLIGEDILEEEREERDSLIQEFYDDIFIKLSIEKQKQINGKEKEHSDLGMEIQIFEDEEYDPKDPKSKEELNELYAKRRDAHKEEIKKYLEAQGMNGEELDNRVKLSAQLVEMEDNQKIMELDFTKRKVGAVSKIFTKIDSVLSSSLLLGGSNKGGDQTKEKLITAGIFAVAGILARSCPIVRNILMAYAGMKLGSAAANLFVSKENKELLKKVSVESLNLESSSDDISKAKSQLLDPKYKESNPIEHAKLQEKIFAIDRAKMEKLLGAAEGDEEGGYIAETNKKLEETIKKRRVAKGTQKGMKIFLGVAGGVAGYFIGDYMSNKAEIKAEEQARQEELAETREDLNEGVEQAQTEAENERLEALALAEKQAEEELRASQEELAKLEAEKLVELNKEIIVEKGDTSWGLAEDQLEKRVEGWDDLNRAEKDYMIDLYKDKMVANPDAIGIDGGDASSLKIGDELDMAKMFSDPDELTTAMNKAQGLSPEAIKNIMANREIIGNVMSQKLENVSGDNLIKAMNIMGGSEQSGAGFVQEFQNRATEIIGTNASPEQMQTILNNPDIFGKIMDAEGLDKITDGDLGLATKVLANNPESIGQDFVSQIRDSGVDSPLNNQFIERANGLNEEIANISKTQSIENIIQPYKDELQMRGEKFVELTNKNTSGFGGSIRRFFGLNGRILQAQESFEEAAEDYHAQAISRNGYSGELLGLGNRYSDLTGDGTLSQTATEYANKVAEDLSNVEENLNKINTGLTDLKQDVQSNGPKETFKKISEMANIKMQFNVGKWGIKIDTSELNK